MQRRIHKNAFPFRTPVFIPLVIKIYLRGRGVLNLREAHPGTIPCGLQQYLHALRQRQHIRSDKLQASPGGAFATKPLDHAAGVNRY